MSHNGRRKFGVYSSTIDLRKAKRYFIILYTHPKNAFKRPAHLAVPFFTPSINLLPFSPMYIIEISNQAERPTEGWVVKFSKVCLGNTFFENLENFQDYFFKKKRYFSGS
jgi:hypothetical protein